MFAVFFCARVHPFQSEVDSFYGQFYLNWIVEIAILLSLRWWGPKCNNQYEGTQRYTDWLNKSYSLSFLWACLPKWNGAPYGGAGKAKITVKTEVNWKFAKGAAFLRLNLNESFLFSFRWIGCNVYHLGDEIKLSMTTTSSHNTQTLTHIDLLICRTHEALYFFCQTHEIYWHFRQVNTSESA